MVLLVLLVRSPSLCFFKGRRYHNFNFVENPRGITNSLNCVTYELMGSYSCKHYIQEMGSLKNNWFCFFALIYSVLFCFFSIGFVLGMKLLQIGPSSSTFVPSKMWHFVDVSFRNFWIPNFWLLILLWCKNIFNLNFSWKYVETIKSSISGKPALFEITAVYAATIFRWQVSKFKIIFWYLCVLLLSLLHRKKEKLKI